MDDPIRQPEAVLARYAAGPDLVEAAIAGLSPADLDLAERDGAWTIRQIVHHVADGDDLWKAFIKQACGHPGSAFDLAWYWEPASRDPGGAKDARWQDEWVERWAYARREIEPSLALFRANRVHIAQLLAHRPDAWEHSLRVHWPGGQEQEVPVAWVVEMQARHVTEHVEEIRRARRVHGV